MRYISKCNLIIKSETKSYFIYWLYTGKKDSYKSNQRLLILKKCNL